MASRDIWFSHSLSSEFRFTNASPTNTEKLNFTISQSDLNYVWIETPSGFVSGRIDIEGNDIVKHLWNIYTP